MRVAIIMGSHTDNEVVEKAEKVLLEFGIEVEKRVMSAHRTPKEVMEFIQTAEARGFECFIGAAGKAAHLPGVIASHTTRPVIGLPIQSSFMGGLDALLSIAQMPAGIPVATVAVNGGENAGLLAVQMLSIKYPELKTKMSDYRESMRQAVIEKDEVYGRVL